MNQTLTDRSVALLLQQLQNISGNCLIVADENWANVNWEMARSSGTGALFMFLVTAMTLTKAQPLPS